MLVLIQETLYALTPYYGLGEFDLKLNEDQTRMQLHHMGQPVVGDVRYYRSGKNGDIHPVTGEFIILPGKQCTFRCVFAGQHLDVMLSAVPTPRSHQECPGPDPVPDPLPSA